MCTVLTLMTAENDLGANSSNSEHYSLDPLSGFSIEGGTRRLIAAYFGIYSRLLCV